MKKLLLILLPFVLFAQPTEIEKRCMIQLKEDKAEINALVELNAAQLKAINDFVAKGPDVTLEYKDEKYYVKTKGEIIVWDKNAERALYVFNRAKFEKDTVLQFKPDETRPHDYIGHTLRFGGGLFFNKANEQVVPDIMLMYEFFSFDKWFGIYGFSLNVDVGIRHVGGSIGYQFVNSKWFSNTNIVLGYSYMFMDMYAAPYIGIALNF